VKCRRGHHGVQTRGARAAYHGIEDERHARLRTLSRSVGTADRCAVTGRCRLLANRAVSRGADWPGQRTAAQVRPAADQERRRPGRHLRRLASVFDNVDHHGDIVRRGAFAKSLSSGSPIPLLWEHKSDDPRNFVGDVVEATETDDGLAITGPVRPRYRVRQVGLPKHQGPQSVRSEHGLRDPQLHQRPPPETS
jgi:hypothetical protein